MQLYGASLKKQKKNSFENEAHTHLIPIRHQHCSLWNLPTNHLQESSKNQHRSWTHNRYWHHYNSHTRYDSCETLKKQKKRVVRALL